MAIDLVRIACPPTPSERLRCGFSQLLVKTKGALNAAGQAQASFVVPRITDKNAIGLTFYHAYLVYDANNNFYLASNPVSLRLAQ